MRIWDLDPSLLCRNHLLGEHRELHAMWSIITQNKKSSYSRHPETLRWVGKLNALYRRHEQQVKEMQARGYNHQSPLDKSLATGESKQTNHVNTPAEQVDIIKAKGCSCRV